MRQCNGCHRYSLVRALLQRVMQFSSVLLMCAELWLLLFYSFLWNILFTPIKAKNIFYESIRATADVEFFICYFLRTTVYLRLVIFVLKFTYCMFIYSWTHKTCINRTHKECVFAFSFNCTSGFFAHFN